MASSTLCNLTLSCRSPRIFFLSFFSSVCFSYTDFPAAHQTRFSLPQTRKGQRKTSDVSFPGSLPSSSMISSSTSLDLNSDSQRPSLTTWLKSHSLLLSFPLLALFFFRALTLTWNLIVCVYLPGNFPSCPMEYKFQGVRTVSALTSGCLLALE